MHCIANISFPCSKFTHLQTGPLNTNFQILVNLLDSSVDLHKFFAARIRLAGIHLEIARWIIQWDRTNIICWLGFGMIMSQTAARSPYIPRYFTSLLVMRTMEQVYNYTYVLFEWVVTKSSWSKHLYNYGTYIVL